MRITSSIAAAERLDRGERALEAGARLRLGVARVQRPPVGTGRRGAAHRDEGAAPDSARIGGGAFGAAAVAIPLCHAQPRG